MLNIREIFGQKVAEPMQSPLTRICPGATALNREEDVERVVSNRKYIFLFWLKVFMFSMLIIHPGGVKFHVELKKENLFLLPQIILINPGETFN